MYSQLCHGGMGLLSPCVNKIILVVKKLLQSLRSSMPWSKLLVISLRHLQLAIGNNMPPFQHIYPIYVYNNVWICRSWKLLHENNISIKVHNRWLLKFCKQRQYDKMIMHPSLLKSFNKKKQRSINNCRMYLKVIMISDIETINGSHIKMSIMNHIPITSKFLWPKIKKPNNCHWVISDNYMQLFRNLNSNQLTRCLGPWFFVIQLLLYIFLHTQQVNISVQ